MRKAVTILVMAAVLILGGCAALFAKDVPACLDPANRAYRDPVIGGICEKCGKAFTFSGYQLDHDKIGTCPYCKHEQGLKDACNRYGEAYLPKNQKKAK